jgi:hypothetical protein
MAAGNTYVAIAEQTLGTAAASVTFSSISGAYTDLVLVVTGTMTGGPDSVVLQFNGDTGSNYSATILSGNGSSASSLRVSTNNGGLIESAQSNSIIHIMNYANSTTYKTILGRGNATASLIRQSVGLWRNTSAITSILVKQDSSGNFLTGSTFSLYGIAAA